MSEKKLFRWSCYFLILVIGTLSTLRQLLPFLSHHKHIYNEWIDINKTWWKNRIGKGWVKIIWLCLKCSRKRNGKCWKIQATHLCAYHLIHEIGRKIDEHEKCVAFYDSERTKRISHLLGDFSRKESHGKEKVQKYFFTSSRSNASVINEWFRSF